MTFFFFQDYPKFWLNLACHNQQEARITSYPHIHTRKTKPAREMFPPADFFSATFFSHQEVVVLGTFRALRRPSDCRIELNLTNKKTQGWVRGEEARREGGTEGTRRGRRGGVTGGGKWREMSTKPSYSTRQSPITVRDTATGVSVPSVESTWLVLPAKYLVLRTVPI